jgi:hypothetical protein
VEALSQEDHDLGVDAALFPVRHADELLVEGARNTDGELHGVVAARISWASR